MTVSTNREGAEVDRVHEVTPPVFSPFLATTSQIGRLLGQIQVPQSLTNLVIFIQSFSRKQRCLKIPPRRYSYPAIQHLKNPPLLRHFLAKLLNSAFRQSFQTKLGSTVSPDPGERWTKSIPQVFFQILIAEILRQLTRSSLYFLHFFLFFVISFQTSGASKLKKY